MDIQAVGLGQRARGAGEVAELAGTDHRDRQVGAGQRGGDGGAHSRQWPISGSRRWRRSILPPNRRQQAHRDRTPASPGQ
jgi:hypothetical protein